LNSTIPLLLVLSLLLCTVEFADAQPTPKLPRIGVLVNGTPASHLLIINEFQKGLRELGYTEGKNVLVEYRFAEGKLERLPELVKELTQISVDVIFTNATPGTVAAKQATDKIPIVFTGVGDPGPERPRS
jgi:ABC-type uncharacterized transport system substrate-binding protein